MTGARTSLRLAGPTAPAILAELCPDDTTPATMAPADLVQAPLAGVRAFIARQDARGAARLHDHGRPRRGGLRLGCHPPHRGAARPDPGRAGGGGRAEDPVIGPLRRWRVMRPRERKSSYDVVIVGGGVHGLAIAYELAKRGVRDVAVLEKAYIGAGGSGRNTAIIRSNYRTPEGVAFYDEIGPDLRATGGRARASTSCSASTAT